MQGAVHFFKFGSPFLSGYHQHWESPKPHTIWHVLYEFTLHPQWSIFLTYPVLILALPGWWFYLRRHTAESLFLLALLYGMFLIVAPLPFWRGESAYGPRYLLYLLPVLSLPALYVLDWLSAPRVRCTHSGSLPLREREKRGSEISFWVRRVLLGGVVLVGVFLAVAQFQVQRIGFFVWRGALWNPAGHSPEIDSYFEYTPVPKICWDHLRCRDHLEDLPYYKAFAHDKTPDQIEAWSARSSPRSPTAICIGFRISTNRGLGLGTRDLGM